MDPSFWNERYAADEWVYGAAPNTFIAEQMHRLEDGAEIIELGAGEGRNAVFLAEQGFQVTALDYAQAGLDKLNRLAAERGVSVDTIRADVTAWQPSRRWDAVVIAYLHLPPEKRPGLYQLIRQVLRSGGLCMAEWFRPEQILEGYDSGGPPRVELMVTPGELRTHFPVSGIQQLEATETTLDEGSHHRGPAAVVRFVWQKSATGPSD